jgi:hypothetical protein
MRKITDHTKRRGYIQIYRRMQNDLPSKNVKIFNFVSTENANKAIIKYSFHIYSLSKMLQLVRM